MSRNRLYLIPVAYACNADCTFCITKQEGVRSRFMSMPPVLSAVDLEQALQRYGSLHVREIEITGGGEPFLHPRLQDVIDLVRKAWPSAYVKLYTNGFRHERIQGVDELNISRAHDDTLRNNELYRAARPTDLRKTLKFFRPMVPTIRLQVALLKGYVDSSDAALGLIERLQDLVDTFVFRPLFDSCDRDRDRYVEFRVEHPQAKNDVTGDYCGTRPVLSTDGKLYLDWSFTRPVAVEDIAAVNADLDAFQPVQIR